MATFFRDPRLTVGNNAIAITPADDTPITDSDDNVIQCTLFVGTAGNVAVKTAGGQSLTFTGVTAGTLLPVVVSEVEDTDTTASNIVGIYNS